MPRNYLALRTVEPKDKVDHGIKGQKWGVRRSPAQLAKDPNSPVQAPATDHVSKEVHGAASGETSAARYARLTAQAKGGGASSMSDTDLKFYNARTEALSKINKLNQQKPSWLADTMKTVLRNAAQRQMQEISNLVADKYIKNKIAESLKDNSKAILEESKTPVDYVGKHRSKK